MSFLVSTGGSAMAILSALAESCTFSVYRKRLHRTLNLVTPFFDAGFLIFTDCVGGEGMNGQGIVAEGVGKRHEFLPWRPSDSTGR